MPLIQSPLPYDASALEPHMSARTFEFHYGKHHKAYVDNTNAAIKGTPQENDDLETIIKTAAKFGNTRLFNNSAQVWNHEFFWRSMTPKPQAPRGKLAEYIERDFGGFEDFKKAFAAEATGHFGSGWVWLILKNGKLQITSYHDANTPLVHDGVTPLLTADVWEHAYYLDHQNARPGFVEVFLKHLADWQGANERLERV